MVKAAKVPPELEQVLAYHRVSEHKFELTGLRTGSIRDQILRAMLVTQALIRTELIDSSKPLLVAGTGAAGVTCALTAARSGIRVLVLESEIGPFRTQMKAAARLIDPVEFDWPHSHWRQGDEQRWPANGPLRFKRRRADAQAQVWDRVFYTWMVNQQRKPNPAWGDIDYYWNVDARTFNYVEGKSPLGQPGVNAVDPDTHQAHFFGAAISCIGFADERVGVDTDPSGYRGYYFWGPDPVEQPLFGLALGPARALVSGGGDGAQQDFLRLLTGSFGRELYDEIVKIAPLRADLIDAVLVEDIARRAFTWGASGQSLPDTLHRWNAEYLKVIDQIWKSWSPIHIEQLATRVLRPEIAVTWLWGGDVPSYSYGLNRLLSQLIARLYAHVTGRPYQTELRRGGYEKCGNEVIIRGYDLVSVSLEETEPVSDPAHKCGKPGECFGIPHVAYVSVRGFIDTEKLGPYELILVRHGVELKPLFGKAPISEQIVSMSPPA
jgi:hypothetical protein